MKTTCIPVEEGDNNGSKGLSHARLLRIIVC